jgi:hypothetical protein
MKPENTLPKPTLSPEEIAAAIATAPEWVDDPDCPYNPNDPSAIEAFWEGSVIRVDGRDIGTVRRRGPQKIPA